LKLSLRTIEGHISRILDKKNLSNRVELALHVRGRQPD
jgi:DNA-binding NarL/FixJ family response regulator